MLPSGAVGSLDFSPPGYETLLKSDVRGREGERTSSESYLSQGSGWFAELELIQQKMKTWWAEVGAAALYCSLLLKVIGLFVL